jgi:ribosome biogenesis GTPase
MQNGNYGKIMLGVGGLYTVRVLSSCDGTPSELEGNTITCRARGAFKHNNVTLLAGDDVIIRPASENDTENFKGKQREHMTEFVIDELCERKNSLIRPPLANLDFIFITMAAASPAPILTTVDKLICIAEFNKIEPIVVITKCELASDYANELAEIYETSGFTVFKLSAVENIGVEPIDQFIRDNLKDGKTAAFAGASGIGKSTLLNRLFPALELSTSEISRKIERGRHTTRKAELYTLGDSLDCGYIADTPGFSMLDFARFDFFEKDDLPSTMREFIPLIEKCRYTKCSHTKEEGCAVLEAVRDGRVAHSRHESYCELHEILKAKKKW